MRPYVFVLVPYLLGSLLVLWVLRGRQLVFAVSSGLLFGLALQVELALGLVLLRYAAGRLPLYDASLLSALTLPAIGAAAIGLWRRCPAWGVERARIASALAAGGGLLAGATAAALHWNYSSFAIDSFAYLERGLALARVADPRYVDLGFLHSRGIFAVLLHAGTDSAGVRYLYFLTPLMSGAFFATLGVAIAVSLRRLGRSRRVAGGSALLCVSWLASCPFVAFQTGFLHVNWPASMYVLLFFFCGWMGVQARDDRWFLLAALALFAFTLLRVEGAAFAAIFVAFLVAQRDGPRPLWVVGALAGPPLLWCLLVALLIGGHGRILDRSELLAMAAGLAACIGLAAWLGRAGHAAAGVRLQAAGLAGLVLVALVLLALDPERMLSRGRVLLDGLLVAGHWGTVWALLGAFALAWPWLGRVPHQGFVVLGLLAYLLVIICLSYVAHWRYAWFDSGNRLFTHVLPSLAWLFAVKSGAGAAPAPRTAGTGR